MKIYFTVDTICNENCETKCPVIEGKLVGSCKCQECKYCYGYSGNFPQWIIFPKDKNGDVVLRPGYYVKCAGTYNEIPRKVKIQRIFYKISYWIKSKCSDIKWKLGFSRF